MKMKFSTLEGMYNIDLLKGCHRIIEGQNSCKKNWEKLS